MSHEMPFKKLIWEFSREADLRNFLRVSLTRELLTKQSWNSLYKVEKHEIWPFNSQLSLHMKWVTKTPRKHVFHTKTTWKTLKNMSDTNYFQKQTKRIKKNLFGLIHIWLSTHTSHLNMYNHTNEIGIHWTLNLCVVCVDQVWNSL